MSNINAASLRVTERNAKGIFSSSDKCKSDSATKSTIPLQFSGASGYPTRNEDTLEEIESMFSALTHTPPVRYTSIVHYRNNSFAEKELYRFSSFPKSWHQHCDETGFSRTSPLARKMLNAVAPTSWRDVYDTLPDAGYYIAQAACFGFDMNGFSIALRCPNGSVSNFYVNFECQNTEFPDVMRLFFTAACCPRAVHRRQAQSHHEKAKS